MLSFLDLDDNNYQTRMMKMIFRYNSQSRENRWKIKKTCYFLARIKINRNRMQSLC